MTTDLLLPLLGGALIGLSATLVLLLQGRVAGISGILGELITTRVGRDWRGGFLAGLLVGGVLLAALVPGAFAVTTGRSGAVVALAGLLVGFGTRLGSGCTSGHGVCGNSRLSPRSMVATVTFIGAGAATVFVFDHLLSAP